MGKNDMEDALKRLDRLTREEARMASAQILKVTNTIDNRLEGITDNVSVVNNRVAGVDERVAGLDGRVARVDNRVAGIRDQVQGVDDKVTAVMEGAQYIFYLLL